MTVYAARKGYISPDIEDPLNYSPENPDNFGFLLQLLVGPSGQEGQESFQVTVCTPDWLKQQYDTEDVILGRHFLIVFEYDYERILKRIDKHLHGCSGNTWKEVAEKVGRLGKWEFEDYRP